MGSGFLTGPAFIVLETIYRRCHLCEAKRLPSHLNSGETSVQLTTERQTNLNVYKEDQGNLLKTHAHCQICRF